MNIEEIENQIVAKLKSEIPDLYIESFPEKPDEFVFTHPIGAVLVHYQGGNYGNTESLGYVVHTKKLEFAFTIITRNLRKNAGAYATLEKVVSLLTGFKIDGCEKMYPIKEGFLSENNGIWQYNISFALTTQNIEFFETE